MKRPYLRTASAATFVLLLLAAAGLCPTASAAPPAPIATCAEQGQTPSAQNCDNGGAWHRQPVTVTWTITPPAVAEPGSCSSGPFGDTGPSGQVVSCTVVDASDPPDSNTSTASVTLRVDTTPPTVTGASPDRPPDSNGWYNHAVGYSFSGTDASSQIAFCTPVVFNGPGATLTGSCQDNAGNVGTATFSVPFDATPPAPPQVRAIDGNGGEALRWPVWADTLRSVVTRAPGPGTAASGTVYSGSGTRFDDDPLTNGEAYRWTVTVFDAAGNSSSASVGGKPDASIGLGPARGATLGAHRLLRWPAVRGARYYNVQVYRGKTKVLSTWPKKAQIKLARTWKFNRHHHRLRPGRYRWYVWPGFGPRIKHLYGSLIGQSNFVVPAPRPKVSP